MRNLNLILVLLVAFLSINLQAQTNIIRTNNPLIEDYVNEFIEISEKKGVELGQDLMWKVKFILVAPEKQDISKMSKSSRKDKIILISNKATIDSLILKMIVFRELFYMLGVKHESCLIMNTKHDPKFSYSVYEIDNIMDVEMRRVLEKLK